MNKPHHHTVGRVSPQGVTRQRCTGISRVSGYAALTRPTNGFNREFFKYQPPRPLAEIDAELAEVEKRIMGMLREVTE